MVFQHKTLNQKRNPLKQKASRPIVACVVTNFPAEVAVVITVINIVYYYGGAITKLYAAGPPYSVKSSNHKLTDTTRPQVVYPGEDAHVS